MVHRQLDITREITHGRCTFKKEKVRQQKLTTSRRGRCRLGKNERDKKKGRIHVEEIRKKENNHSGSSQKKKKVNGGNIRHAIQQKEAPARKIRLSRLQVAGKGEGKADRSANCGGT